MLHLGQLLGNYHHIQIKADQRFDVGIHSLAADHAVGNVMFLKQRRELFQQVGFIHCHHLEKGLRLHALIIAYPLCFV